MTMRTIAFLIMGLMLGGCMQETREPSTQVSWKPRDKELMSNLPYAQATIPEPYRRHIVSFDRKEAPGSIVVDIKHRYLYYVLGNNQAMRYSIAVGMEGYGFRGTTTVSMKREWPDWTPTPGELKRFPDLPKHMEGGADNPLGARALYLGSTLFRIHGTNEPWKIGAAVSSGCIRMANDDAIDLYDRARVGATVIVRR